LKSGRCCCARRCCRNASWNGSGSCAPPVRSCCFCAGSSCVQTPSGRRILWNGEIRWNAPAVCSTDWRPRCAFWSSISCRCSCVRLAASAAAGSVCGSGRAAHSFRCRNGAFRSCSSPCGWCRSFRPFRRLKICGGSHRRGSTCRRLSRGASPCRCRRCAEWARAGYPVRLQAWCHRSCGSGWLHLPDSVRNRWSGASRGCCRPDPKSRSCAGGWRWHGCPRRTGVVPNHDNCRHRPSNLHPSPSRNGDDGSTSFPSSRHSHTTGHKSPNRRNN